MIDLINKNYYPTLDEIAEFVNNVSFMQFCTEMKNLYKCKEKIEYSSCSWEKGWNIKFKKAGKTLCTIYPREHYFTVMVVVGQKEKASVEAILPMCTPEMQDIYNECKEGNGQRWLMINIEDKDRIYHDVFRLIEIRKNGGFPV